MPLHYHLDEREGVVLGKASGAVTEREIVDTVDDIVRSTSGKFLHYNIITVLDGTTSLHLIDALALRRILVHLETWTKAYPNGTVKSAFVTQNRADASLLRVWKALTELNPSMGRCIQIFANEADASAWLSE